MYKRIPERSKISSPNRSFCDDDFSAGGRVPLGLLVSSKKSGRVSERFDEVPGR
jgi:hypothetical protein